MSTLPIPEDLLSAMLSHLSDAAELGKEAEQLAYKASRKAERAHELTHHAKHTLEQWKSHEGQKPKWPEGLGSVVEVLDAMLERKAEQTEAECNNDYDDANDAEEACNGLRQVLVAALGVTS